MEKDVDYLEKAYNSFLPHNSNKDVLRQIQSWIEFPLIVTDAIFRITNTINCENSSIQFLNSILEIGFIDSDNLRMLSETIQVQQNGLPNTYFGTVRLMDQTVSLAIVQSVQNTTCVCTLFAMRLQQEFSPGEQELLKRCGYLFMCMYALSSYESLSKHNVPDGNILQLLKGNFTHEKEMRNQFSYTQILPKSLFYVLLTGYLHEHSSNQKKSAAKRSIRYYLFYLNNTIPNSHSILYENYIITILSTDLSNKEYTAMLKGMKEFLDKEGLFLISSNPTPNIRDIPILFQQVQKGLEFLDDKNRPFGNVAFYRQFALRHMYQFCENNRILRSFCHPAVLELADYDRKNNTNYLHTLYCYLRYNQQLTITAKEMFIHRNTLSYRLEKIFNMTGLDKNNGTEIAHVLISIEIYYKGYPPVVKKE